MGSTMLMNSNFQMFLCIMAAIVMCNRYYAAWPFDNQCPITNVETGNTTYVICERWQNGLLFGQREYMLEEQVNASQGFGLALIVISSTLGGYFLIFQSEYSIKNLLFGINESDSAGEANDNKFTTGALSDSN
jgi:hypothetical protein